MPEVPHVSLTLCNGSNFPVKAESRSFHYKHKHLLGTPALALASHSCRALDDSLTLWASVSLSVKWRWCVCLGDSHWDSDLAKWWGEQVATSFYSPGLRARGAT